MASVPPFMKPEKVKHLLSQFGEVLRIYLAEEGKKSRYNIEKKTTPILCVWSKCNPIFHFFNIFIDIHS